ncbi:hypothetical protein F5X98DRAFT_356334, partial [Xylaria grammica]
MRSFNPKPTVCAITIGRPGSAAPFRHRRFLKSIALVPSHKLTTLTTSLAHYLNTAYSCTVIVSGPPGIPLVATSGPTNHACSRFYEYLPCSVTVTPAKTVFRGFTATRRVSRLCGRVASPRRTYQRLRVISVWFDCLSKPLFCVSWSYNCACILESSLYHASSQLP